MSPAGALVAIGCLVGFLYQSQRVITSYLRYDFSVVQWEVSRMGIEFPAVTVCLDDWMSTDRLCNYTRGKCSKKDMTITYGVFHPQYIPDLRIHGAYLPQEIFQCSFASEDPRCEPFDCVSSLKRTYFRPPTQQCYTVDAWNDSHFRQCPSPWSWELQLYASWDPQNTMVFFDTGSLATVVHQARTCPVDKLTAVALQPGKLLTVAVSQRRVQRLPSPYKSKCSDYIARGIYPAFEGYLNYDSSAYIWRPDGQSCMQHCSMELERERCGCVRPQHEFAGAVGWTNCQLQESGACFHALNASGAYTSCERRCGLPCEEIVYDVKLSGITEEGGFKHDRKNSVGLEVKFSSDVQQVVQYVPVITRVEVLGYLSGYLGIWLGLSLATVALQAHKRFCPAHWPSSTERP
ncbi:degenerin deg-1-like [Amblyomma americanum]